MTGPAVRPQQPRTRPLPPPDLVSLVDDPHGPYADSPAGWWDQYGGAVSATGVVYLPGPTHPTNARHGDCPNCVPLWRNS